MNKLSMAILLIAFWVVYPFTFMFISMTTSPQLDTKVIDLQSRLDKANTDSVIDFLGVQVSIMFSMFKFFASTIGMKVLEAGPIFLIFNIIMFIISCLIVFLFIRGD